MGLEESIQERGGGGVLTPALKFLLVSSVSVEACG